MQYTYRYENEEEVELTLMYPGRPERNYGSPENYDPGAPPAWAPEHITFLGVPCPLAPEKIAAALWPSDFEARKKFWLAYWGLIADAEAHANENADFT